MSIEYSSTVDAPVDEVFAWHQRPGALHRLLPPWQPMTALTEANSLESGRAVLGLPAGLRWYAQHQPDGYDAPHRFVDERVGAAVRGRLPGLAGPWRHEHLFADAGAGQTRMTDRVRTAVPARALRSTFRYRHQQVADDLAVHAAAGSAPMVVAVTGSWGTVGTALTAFLTTGGHQVIRLVRRPARDATERQWDPHRPAPDLLAGVDAVVHLAGAPIFGRFTSAHKESIRSSRVGPTARLAQVAANSSDGPVTFVSASAIGYYGHDREAERLDEDCAPGSDFLADVVVEWERAASAAADAGIRTVAVRTGIVQTPRGGVLRLQYPIFRAGVGGPLGDGSQVLSWIDLDDLVDIYYRALYDTGLTGPVNATAPAPVSAGEYARVLAHVMHRPAAVPVPGFGPRLLLGAQGAAELALADQFVVPGRLRARGHRFRRPDLASCLRHQLGRG